MFKETLIAVALSGQNITKDTRVSILLVIMLVGATMTITALVTNMQNDVAAVNKNIENVEENVKEIRKRQDEIYQYVIGNPLAPKEPSR